MRKSLLLSVVATALLAIFVGTAFAVDKVCTKDKTCRGTQQADGLTGTDSPDKILGLGGRDVIYGFGGKDKIYGGDDSDFLRGDDGNDKMFGQVGLDSVIGSGGNDMLYGDDPNSAASGTDNVAGSLGNDSEYGGPDNDLLGNIQFGEDNVVDKGEDVLVGGPGNDRFYTRDNERDEISCGTGNNDTVYKDRKDTVTADCENVWNSVPNSRDKGNVYGVAIEGAVPAGAEAISGS